MPAIRMALQRGLHDAPGRLHRDATRFAGRSRALTHSRNAVRTTLPVICTQMRGGSHGAARCSHSAATRFARGSRTLTDRCNAVRTTLPDACPRMQRGSRNAPGVSHTAATRFAPPNQQGRLDGVGASYFPLGRATLPKTEGEHDPAPASMTHASSAGFCCHSVQFSTDANVTHAR